MKRAPLLRCRHHAVLSAAMIVVTCAIAFASHSALADPTQEDVLKSISQSVDSRVDASHFFAVVIGVVGLIVVATLVSKIKARKPAAPRSVNHSGRLVRDLSKRIRLGRSELRQLKLLAEESGINPLTFLLCPSLLAKAVREQPGKVDRAAITSISRKLR